MIVSASRRTDIPSFYSKWFLQRIKAGFCEVPNPFNPKQISVVSLRPNDVEAIVFWTKNPAPMLHELKNLESLGFRFYFQFTLNDYPMELEPNIPSLMERVLTFKKLSDLIGPRRVIWRYDPIIISNKTDVIFHKKGFESLFKKIAPFTKRIMTSIVDLYEKTDRNFEELQKKGWSFSNPKQVEDASIELLRFMAEIAKTDMIEIFTCAEVRNFSYLGIPPGKCIDGDLIESLWGIHGSWKKDKGQRKECGCITSREIGMNNTCRNGCTYCYATTNYKLACLRSKEHNPNSTILIGDPKIEEQNEKQKSLFKMFR